MKAINRKLVGDLLHLKGPIIAVGLVIACGIAMLVAMVSVHVSLDATRESYYASHRFANLFCTVRRAPLRALDALRDIKGVAAVDDRIVKDVSIDVPGLDEPANARMISVPDDQRAMLNDVYVRAGRYIERGRRDEVIASEAFMGANDMQLGDTLAAVVNGHRCVLRVVGVGLSPEYTYEIAPGLMFPDSRRFAVLWMSREALGALFDMDGAFNDVSFRLLAGANEHDVIDRIDGVLAPYGGFGAYGRTDQISSRVLDDELRQLAVNAVLVPVIFLGVAVFLLHTVLSRLIGTQRDQIAVLKAFGYSNRAVGAHYLLMSLVAVLVGGLLGIGVGVWLGSELTTAYARFFRFPTFVYAPDLLSMALAVAVSALAASIGALGAVRVAVSLPAAEAMRPASPGRYHPLLLERIGLQRLLSTGTRMVLRNLERTPLKAGASILGLAMAVATLLMARFAFDGFDVIRDHQFRAVQREDVAVTFDAPRPASALLALASIPGVMSVEPSRIAPVRLRVGHRVRRLAVLAVDTSSALRRVVASDGSVHVPVTDGLSMTRYLADVLSVQCGDTVIIESLEGQRRHSQVIVTTLVDETMGANLYATRSTLDRIVGGAEVVTGAYLRVDALLARDLYDRLKRTPAVAGATLREATIDGFDRTIAQSQAMSGAMVTIFGIVIAVGIVYNSARISLSERGRELASLRVLGFTRREVAMLLFGEQAILTAIAIPVGFALGYVCCWAIVDAYSTESLRLPLLIANSSLVYAVAIVAASWLASALLIRNRLNNLDLVEVLKTRE